MAHRLRLYRRGVPRAFAVAVVALASGCIATPDRPARSTLSCAEAAIDRELPAGLPDKLAHCIAGGLIARYCSPSEARLAGVAKELRDAFTGGDVELADIQATLAGVRCAQESSAADAIEACCRARRF